MKLLRPQTGYTLYDHKTNDYIRCELRFAGILDKIDEYRRNWLSRLQRMSQNRIPFKSYRYRPQGRRTIGRPNKRWREQLQFWRRNGSKGPILDVYADDDYISYSIKYLLKVVFCFRHYYIIAGEEYWLHFCNTLAVCTAVLWNNETKKGYMFRKY